MAANDDPAGPELLRTSRAVITRRAEGELVLLDTEHDRVYGVEGVGVRILELLDEARTVDDVVEVLLTEYDVDADRVRADVRGFIGRLRDRGLVQEADQGRR